MALEELRRSTGAPVMLMSEENEILTDPVKNLMVLYGNGTSCSGGDVLLNDGDNIPLGENVIKAIQTPVEERGWLGDPDFGLCPNCHGGLVFKGEPHWDGIHFPFECAVCGAGLKLTPEGKFEIVENGLIRDRNVDEARGYHLDEIVATRMDFFRQRESDPAVKETISKYREIKFPAI